MYVSVMGGKRGVWLVSRLVGWFVFSMMMVIGSNRGRGLEDILRCVPADVDSLIWRREVPGHPLVH